MREPAKCFVKVSLRHWLDLPYGCYSSIRAVVFIERAVDFETARLFVKQHLYFPCKLGPRQGFGTPFELRVMARSVLSPHRSDRSIFPCQSKQKAIPVYPSLALEEVRSFIRKSSSSITWQKSQGLPSTVSFRLCPIAWISIH